MYDRIHEAPLLGQGQGHFQSSWYIYDRSYSPHLQMGMWGQRGEKTCQIMEQVSGPHLEDSEHLGLEGKEGTGLRPSRRPRAGPDCPASPRQNKSGWVHVPSVVPHSSSHITNSGPLAAQSKDTRRTRRWRTCQWPAAQRSGGWCFCNTRLWILFLVSYDLNLAGSWIGYVSWPHIY